jgi:uncharacterized membrane protein (UPF0136 family)
MNLVALLAAPLVVDYRGDTGVRFAIAAVAALIVAAAVWYSKSRRPLAMVEPTDTGAAVAEEAATV